MRLLPTAGALVAALALAAGGCGQPDPGQGSGPLTVYMSVPLSGERGAEGEKIAAGAKQALAAAGGKAGDREIKLVVLGDTGGGARWNPVTAAANARTATEDADTIAFIGDLDEGATGTSLPITDLAEIPQVALGGIPPEVDVENLVRLDPAEVSGDRGAAAMTLVLEGIKRAGDDGTDRLKVRDTIREAASSPTQSYVPPSSSAP